MEFLEDTVHPLNHISPSWYQLVCSGFGDMDQTWNFAIYMKNDEHMKTCMMWNLPPKRVSILNCIVKSVDFSFILLPVLTMRILAL